MKVWKLVSGILSIVLFAMVAFQSCAAGLSNSLQQNGEVSGSAGIIVAFMMLTGGIVSIATRKAMRKNGGNIALIVLFGLAALIGFGNCASFPDLAIWAGWCVINMVIAIVSLVFNGTRRDDPNMNGQMF
uniref:Lipoprotein n=1 Tax=Eubacterium cellulosolvens (strain ATCC 43171 / JCM 9499 / 6) TaxID=633697 RepID=I5AUF9_EUBC6